MTTIFQTKETLWRLKEPCKNPKPDRRIKDNWTCLPEFPPGLYLLTEREEKTDDGKARFWSREIQRVTANGSTFYGCLHEYNNKKEFAAIKEQFVREEINPHNLQHMLALHRDMEPRHMFDVLEWLLRNGIVSPDQLNIAFDRVLEMWEE